MVFKQDHPHIIRPPPTMHFGRHYISMHGFIHPQFFVLDSFHLPVKSISVDYHEGG
jgi:hypothetical protein